MHVRFTRTAAAVDTPMVKPARPPPPCHHASRDPANEIVQGSGGPAAARVHAPAAAIRRASLIKINYVCRVIARLIESDSTASPMPMPQPPLKGFRPQRRRRKMGRLAAAESTFCTATLLYVSLIPSHARAYEHRHRRSRRYDVVAV